MSVDKWIIGEFELSPFGAKQGNLRLAKQGKLWLTKQGGEGMETQAEAVFKVLEDALRKYWDENF